MRIYSIFGWTWRHDGDDVLKEYLACSDKSADAHWCHSNFRNVCSAPLWCMCWCGASTEQTIAQLGIEIKTASRFPTVCLPQYQTERIAMSSLSLRQRFVRRTRKRFIHQISFNFVEISLQPGGSFASAWSTATMTAVFST